MTRTKQGQTQKTTSQTWVGQVRVVHKAAGEKDKVVPQAPQAEKARVIRVPVRQNPRMTIKGNLRGYVTNRMPEISRPVAGRTMF